MQNRYLDFSIDPSCQRVNRLFVFSFKDEDGWKIYKQYHLPIVEIEDHNVMIDGKNFFYHSIKSYVKTYDNIRKIATGQGDNYTTGCLLDYPYFKKYFKLIAIDLSKQQKLYANPKAIQENFTGKLNGAESAGMYFVIEEATKSNTRNFYWKTK